MDPLAKLKTIHLPEQINQYPIAIGWWLLVALLIMSLFWGIKVYFRYSRLRKVKRTALKKLQQNPELCVQEVLLLLKWAALTYFPRAQCANLYGKNWQNFLSVTLPTKLPAKQRVKFNEKLSLSATNFDKIYHKNTTNLIDININELALIWIKFALPAKDVSVLQLNKAIK